MTLEIKHRFEGANYDVVGDACGIRVTGPDRSGVLVHFVKIFHECAIQVTALHASRPTDGQLVLEFEFEFEDIDDLSLLIDELSKTY